MNSLRYSALFLILILTGCGGYTFGEGNSSVLPPEYHTIAVREVTNPTTLSWLEPRIRKLLRDELNNRGTFTWVDNQDRADSVISIKITKYYRPTAVSGGSDETLRSVAKFTFNAVIRSTTDDSVLWQSGDMYQDWPFFTGDEAEADAEVTRLGIRRLADRMTQNY
nr:LPS assembly lipoprotein LptE [Pseudodesulfovibrio sp.]